MIIDEDELTAIATRRLFAEYSYFKNGEEIAVTEKVELVAKDGKEYFTSLLAIHNVAKKLKKIFHKPKGTLENARENVKFFQSVISVFMDLIIENEPSLHLYFVEGKTTPGKERKGNRNLVFRPIGLELLARLYVHFYIKQKMQVFKWALANLTWKCPGGVWDGTVWSHEKIQPKAKVAAIDYVLYLLHEFPDSAIVNLTESIREFRNDENYKLPDRIKLPSSLMKD